MVLSVEYYQAIKKNVLMHVTTWMNVENSMLSKKGLSGGSLIKNLSANAGDVGSIPWLGRSPEGGNGNPL